MLQRRAEIANGRTTCRILSACVALALVAGAGCSANAPGGSGVYVAATDTAGQGFPGLDGLVFDIQPSDAGDTAAPDVPDALPADVSTGIDDDARDVADDATAADAVVLACQNTCEIDDDCNVAADPCTASVCQFGCCQVTPTVGAPCDDGVPCNGPDACKNGVCTPAQPAGCDDGLACTFDTCDGEKCHHTVVDGYCHIGSTCVEATASIPGDPCKICDPSQDQESWSKLPGCCKVDADCPILGACDKPTCDATQGKCLIVKVPGCCKGDSDCDDGDLCTTDSCDLASGNCASTAISCAGPSTCQIAACDSADGQCKAQLLTGWCFIDGQCYSTTEPNPANPCQICVDGNAPTSWSPTPGTFCTDNNPCTFSDICTSAGVCKGTAQPGCCQTDADCSNSGIACKVGQCNTGVGLCSLSDKPGCCTAGVCCDVANQAILPAGTACGTSVIGSDYQCSGNDIQKHDFSPGCNGTSPTVCASSLSTAAAGPWATINTCPAGTQCTPQGSGVMPVCQMLGSCAGACGGAGTYGCGCSADCVANGTCCPDATGACGCSAGTCCDVSAGLVLATGTPCGANDAATQWQCAGNDVQKRVGQGKCMGAADCSTAAADVIWSGWQTTQTCTGTCTAAADGSSATCSAPAGSCLGSCGQQSNFGPCSCTVGCKAAGTCCADYDARGCDAAQYCGSQGNTCAGACGGLSNSGACYCDDLCNTYGDCCPDKFICGCSP